VWSPCTQVCQCYAHENDLKHGAGTAYHFNRTIGTPRFEDYDYTYVEPLSRFSYLGFGQTWEEVNLGEDVYYRFLAEREHMTENHPALQASAPKVEAKQAEATK
jgi:hypothetical protein